MKKILRSYWMTFVFCFMLFIYEPIVMYATNKDDFWFGFNTMIVPVLKTFLIFLLIGCAVFTIIYFVGKFCIGGGKKSTLNNWLYNGSLLVLAIVFLATYIQGNYLIGNLPGLDGSDINWSLYLKDDIITLVIWIVLIAVSVFSVIKLHLEKTVKIASYLSLAIFLMLMTSLASVVISNDVFEKEDKYYVTSNNINDISKNKNFLIFLIDATDSKNFYDVWQNDEDFKDMFNDFTYYSNAMSAHPYTKESVSYILSGHMFKNQKEFSDFSSEAYNDSVLFKNLEKRKYSINLYEDSLVWNGNHQFDVGNVVSVKNADVNFFSFFKQEMKYVLFKYVPYGLKKYSRIESMNFDLCIDKFRRNNEYIYDLLLENQKLHKENENYFQFIHIEGSHVPHDLDKEMKPIKNGTYSDKISSSLTIVKTYLNRLKENGVYDNSVIIVMSDHGWSNTNLLARMNPTFLVKGFDEHHDTIISDAPVHYDDLQDMYAELLDGKNSTDLFQDLDSNRKRVFVSYAFNKEDHMVEYETTGHVRDLDQFKATGKIYDR